MGSPIVFHTAPPQPASNARMICSPIFVGGADASQNGFGERIPAKFTAKSGKRFPSLSFSCITTSSAPNNPALKGRGFNNPALKGRGFTACEKNQHPPPSEGQVHPTARSFSPPPPDRPSDSALDPPESTPLSYFGHDLNSLRKNSTTLN